LNDIGTGEVVSGPLPASAPAHQHRISEQPSVSYAVYGDFISLYQLHAPDLGSPIAQVKTSSSAYEARYQNAMVVWIYPLLTFFELTEDGKLRTLHEFDWGSGDQQFNDDAKARQMFHTPGNSKPPYGGVASHWNKLNWFGSRIWHCYSDPGLVSYQEFQHGVMAGSFRLNKKGGPGQIFAFVDDKNWYSLGEPISVQPPNCVEPLNAPN
jgi:hypothetical protein